LNSINANQEPKSTSDHISENSTSGDESSSMKEGNSLEKHLDEQAIDLNELFPDAETDLNDLFPEDEVKHLLKKIIKNKKDMGLIKKRLTTENETSDDN
jgi:hypothetical protein